MAENTGIVKKKRRKRGSDGSMTILEHMSALRKCIVIIAAAFFAAVVVSFYFAPRFIRICLDLAVGYTFVQTGPAELLGQYAKVSVICGVVAAIPVLIWQAHRFASPGLKKSEDRVFLGIMLSSVVFFALGAVFCYFIVLPFMLQFFLSLNTIDILGMYSVKEYISYLVSVIVAFGVIFEIPVLSSILALAGFLKPAVMVRGRRVVIILNFIIGAAITPTDVVSQFLVAAPMCLLYELSIVIVRVIASARAKRRPEEADEAARAGIRSERQSRWQRAAALAEQQSREKNGKRGS